MRRSLRAELEQLRKEAERVIGFRKSEEDERIMQWMRDQPNLHEALYPHEADKDASRARAQYHDRYQELAREGVTTQKPPPEFLPDRPERIRRTAWLLELDPPLRELACWSDLGERYRRVLAGGPPSPAVEAFVDREPERAYDELGPIEVVGSVAEIGDLILRARWEADDLGADAVLFNVETAESPLGDQGPAEKGPTVKGLAVQWRE